MTFATKLTFIVLLAASVHSFGQGFQGGLRGSARDAGGGVAPGVEVTLTNEATSLARTTATNDAGEYSFAAIDPGSYRMHASLPGFKALDQPGIRIGTQQFVTLDLKLEVGAVAETVSVSAEVPLVETSNASTGTVLDTLSLQTLPAPGRNAFMIGVTVPTVIPSGDTQFNRQQDQTNASLLSLGGGTRRGNNYTLDGVPITDLRNRATANPTIESLEDVKVQVHTYDAEMGRTGGGVFNTTLRTGSNGFHGTGFFQTRPIWAEENNFFSQKAGIPKPNNPYYLFGGGFGGPIIKNRTFFWFAAEDYHDIQTRNISVIFPTLAERAGDFSALTDAQGRPVIIYDPLTSRTVNGAIVRDPFPGNRIANRINPVAAAMLKYLPLPDKNIDNGGTNYTRTALINNRFQQEYTIKIDHKVTDKVSVSGFYLYNRTNEPDADYFEPGLTGPNRFADPNRYLLKRRPQIIAVTSTSTLSSSSVLALRFGWTRFPDNNTMTANFDPATLGFSPTFLSQVSLKKFPDVRIRGYDQSTLPATPVTMGANDPTQINWKSMTFNGSYSKFIGTHTFKMGADFRKMVLDTYIPGPGSGFFDFEKDWTSANGGTSDVLSGNPFAAFLLGFPSGLSSRQSTLPISTPLNLYTHYYGGYWQDDWRITPKLTLNYGLRAEHEDGLREQHNNFSVGFDPKATSRLSNVTIPADPIAGTAARQVTGGLIYAGLAGNKTSQGNPPSVKWSPRLGGAYSFTSQTVLRGGYGIFWAPYNYPIPNTTNSNYGQVGFTQNTVSVPQTTLIPTVTLDNPFPNCVVQPTGSRLGALTGGGTTISFVDQNRKAPRVEQYSVDIQRQLPDNMAISIGYVGARSERLGLGGSADTPVNINQVDPKYLSLGAALTQQVANPFFGRPEFGNSNLGSSPTIARNQLLRPYPQFLNINARQVTEGLSRYNAGVIEWTKRLSHGWGGRASYTYSVLKDNQVGESNFYSAVSPGLPLNNYNYLASMPRCASGAQFTSACYD